MTLQHELAAVLATLQVMGTSSVDERIAATLAAYDARAREYKEAIRKLRPVADVRRFAQLAADSALVLDAGCGPASDLRALRDAGLRPVGVDLSSGVLDEARLLLPKDPLVRAQFSRLPFRRRVFRGLWMNAAFAHLPRGVWTDAFATLLGYLETGPVYFTCIRGSGDLELVDDAVLGPIYRSDAREEEVETLLASHGLRDVQVELRPDPVYDRKRPWVVAFGRQI